jgi:transcriptional regulator with XRE-family HTH domain
MNDTLRAVRRSMLLTQDDLAGRLREAGTKLGLPSDINKRTVQRWEAGVTLEPRADHARLLQMVTGLPMEQLGFPSGADRLLLEDGRGGHDLAVRAEAAAPGLPRAPAGNYTGIWLSRYEYFSSGRDVALEGKHIALVVQTGEHVAVRSLPNSNPSTMAMTLTLEGSVVTGTWFEQTEQDGYYRGARYHGAIQMLADPTGRRFSGKWLGFGKGGEVNSGPWSLTFLDNSTSHTAIARHDRPFRADS